MAPQNGTTVDLNVNTSSDPMAVYFTDDESVLTISPIDTPKTPYQPASVTSYYLRYTLRTSSKSALYPSAVLPAALTSSSKSHKDKE